jgi:3',5'-cyclic AMP phosphodiesterase CpdA
MNLTQQLVIIHLSDIHFSNLEKRPERFSPGRAVGEGALKKKGFPTFVEKLGEDLRGADPKCPVIACITGDLTETASDGEFKLAREFILQLAETPIFGQKRGLQNVFVIPGNHDVTYNLKTVEERWQNWTNFHNETLGTEFKRHQPADCVRVMDRVDDLGAVILCLNSAEYVENNTPEANRGQIGHDQLTRITEQLERISPERLGSAIRIALIHHHPVLIPGLANPGAGYDAVENSRFLLNELRRFGFHLILHGHKHQPYNFSEDSYTAFASDKQPPLTIVAGGSANSLDLCEHGYNAYNQIVIKWIPASKQGRILINTRGLQTKNRGADLLPARWRWVTLLEDDRQLSVGPRTPAPSKVASRKFRSADDDVAEGLRVARYQYLRGNMPVCEVMPSLLAGQHYEVRLWIEPHRQDPTRDMPTAVTWSAGKRHGVVTVTHDRDPLFCTTLNYYGPMMVQASLHFPGLNGEPDETVYAYVYARIPKEYSRHDGGTNVR